MGRRWVVALLAVGACSVAACGGGDDDDGGVSVATSTSGTETSTADTGAAAETTAPASGAVGDITDARNAVVQIVARGTFAEPAESLAAYEEVTGAGSGSGFIIDPEGIAVTNNHVVTGAASLEVFVEGQEDPVNARVLGVSECADLAVIDLDGEGYPYLQWYTDAIEPGLEVRAAGFPLGDPEYTLTQGIVSKADADGETPWASVDSVIEHDASIQPGNSGGPLLDAATARVVAVNYATGDPGTGTNQFFAISGEEAEAIVEELRAGADVLSLGINGQAVVDEDAGVAGIWVASVASGSPAGDLGVQGGDIIERIEGLPLGTDGTMKDYCDILQSHDREDVLSAQVLRFADEARLKGEFNGDELEPYEPLGGQEPASALPPGEPYTDYVTVRDDSGTLEMNVPVEWADVDGAPVVLDDGTEIRDLQAAPDLAAFNGSWSASGVDFAAVDPSLGLTATDLLDQITPECTDGGRQAYDDGLYVGEIQVWTQCEGTASETYVIAAEPEGGEFIVRVVAQIATQADFEALDQIVATFKVTG
jgi:serine protease Do